MKSFLVLLVLATVVAVVVMGQPSPGGGPFPVPSLPTIVRTNFISGQLYTNTYGKSIQVSCLASNVDAAVAGNTFLALWCYAQPGNDPNGFTNQFGETHQATVIAVTNLGMLDGFIPSSFVWTFTNLLTGAGDIATPTMGQIWVP